MSSWHIGTIVSTLFGPERLIRIDDLVLTYPADQAEALKSFRPGMAVRYQISTDKKTLTAIEAKKIVAPTTQKPPEKQANSSSFLTPPPTQEGSSKPSQLPWKRHEDYSVSICATVNLDNYENIRVDFGGRVTCGSDIDLIICRMDEVLSRFGSDGPTKEKISAYRKRVIGKT